MVSQIPFQLTTSPSIYVITWNMRLIIFQTQSARGENQNRPTSSGYTGGPVGGAVSGPQAGRANTATADTGATGFPGGPENSNSILSPNLDPSQDTSAYGYTSMVGQGHNGTGGESY